MRRALEAYNQRIVDHSLRTIDEVRLLATSFDSMLVFRGMSTQDFGNPAGWLELERLATLLAEACPRGGADDPVTIRWQ